MQRNALHLACSFSPDPGKAQLKRFGWGLSTESSRGRRELVRFLCRWDADSSRQGIWFQPWRPWLAWLRCMRLKAMRDCRGRRPQDLYLGRQGLGLEMRGKRFAAQRLRLLALRGQARGEACRRMPCLKTSRHFGRCGGLQAHGLVS